MRMQGKIAHAEKWSDCQSGCRWYTCLPVPHTAPSPHQKLRQQHGLGSLVLMSKNTGEEKGDIWIYEYMEMDVWK